MNNIKDKIHFISNTQWSKQSEYAINDVYDALIRHGKHHKNVKCYIDFEQSEKAVFFDFSINTDNIKNVTLRDIQITKISCATESGFEIIQNLSKGQKMLLLYTALGYLRIL